MTSLTFISDPGHGWLMVPLADVLASGARISEFSFISPDGQTAFLEEDCDAPAYLDTLSAPPRISYVEVDGFQRPQRRFPA